LEILNSRRNIARHLTIIKICDYEKPKVILVGTDSNVFALLWKCQKALRAAGQLDAVKEIQEKVTSCGSYDEALCIMMDYCEVVIILLSYISNNRTCH